MKILVKNIVAGLVSLLCFNVAIAQQNPMTLTGLFTEKVNAELQLFKTGDNKQSKNVGDYTINPSNPEFVFAIPADSGVDYTLQIKTLKQGHIRLEADKWFAIHLVMKPGGNYSLNITPSKLNGEKKTGFVLKSAPGKSSVAFVSGKFTGFSLGANVSILRVVDGDYQTINGISNSKEKSFVLPCLVKEEGFYYLSSLRWKLRVYLKPGDKLDLDIDGKWGSYIVNSGSEENKSMQKWQELIRPITAYGYQTNMVHMDTTPINSYVETYKVLAPAIEKFRNNFNQTRSKFNSLFQVAMDVDKELAPMVFLLHTTIRDIKGFKPTPRDFKEVPVFYQEFIQPGKFKNASLLKIGEARRYMDLYTKLVVASLPADQRKELTKSEKLGMKINAISNDTLKSYFFRDQMSEIDINNLTEFRSTFEPYKKYTKSEAAKKKYQAVYETFIGDTAYVGKSSYNFSLPDTNGRMVSMKDFKGKVVFIDVWATWCGPCKEQFPYYKEIEEEYKDNKDIVFIGISTDKLKDREKWLKMIRKENLGGLQLLDDFGKAFARPYEITGIPRFLLIDRQGKWIEVRCPRPGDKQDLKRYLDKALQENNLSKD